MKTVYSSDSIEVNVNLSRLNTGNYTYEVQEYAPINSSYPQQFVLNWEAIYKGTCFVIGGTQRKSFNITDIVESRKSYYSDVLATSGERINLLNQYRVVVDPDAANPRFSEIVQVIFFEQYPNYKSSMNPLGIESEDLFGDSSTYYPIVSPLIQGVRSPDDAENNESIPALTPILPLGQYTYPLVSLVTPAYQYEPFKIITEGTYVLDTDLTVENLKLAPTFVTGINIGNLRHSVFDTTLINPTNYFTVVDYDGIDEVFSHERYRTFNWTATSPTSYYCHLYLTDGTTNLTITSSYITPGETTTFTPNLFAGARENFIRNHNNVELVLKLEGNGETKYVSFDCSWLNSEYPQVDGEQIEIWFTVDIHYGTVIYVDFGKKHIDMSPELDEFSKILKRRSGDNSIWLETWFTTKNTDTGFYDSDVWTVNTLDDGYYDIRNINPADVTAFEFRLQVIIGGTIEQDFRVFPLRNQNQGFVIDASEPDIANILGRIDLWYPEAEVVLRLASVDPPITDIGFVQIEITSLLRNLESSNGTYIEFSTGTYQTSEGERLYAYIKFRDKDLKERCKIADIDTQICTDIKRYYLMWQDRFGGFQCQPFEKTETYQEDLKRHEWATYQNAKRLGGIEVQPKWKLNTGWIKDELYPYYESILISPYIMLIDVIEDKTYRVLVNDSNYTEKTFKNQGRQLFNLELTVSQDKPQQILY